MRPSLWEKFSSAALKMRSEIEKLKSLDAIDLHCKQMGNVFKQIEGVFFYISTVFAIFSETLLNTSLHQRIAFPPSQHVAHNSPLENNISNPLNINRRARKCHKLKRDE